MTQKNLFPTVTLSQEDTPVSRLLSQENKKRKRMTDTSGRTCIKLLHKKDPLMQFSKMFMVTLDWASTRCSLTWKPKVTPQGRLLFQLAPSMLPIEEIDCGSSPKMWATPAAADSIGSTGGGQGKSLRTDVRMWPTPMARDWKGGRTAETLKKNGRSITNSLPDAVTGQLWPTPTASTNGPGTDRNNPRGIQQGNALATAVVWESKGWWPTPTANEDHAGRPGGKMQKMLGNHPEVRGTTEAEWNRGSLNPTWVEWLMGYPEGWTDLGD